MYFPFAEWPRVKFTVGLPKVSIRPFVHHNRIPSAAQFQHCLFTLRFKGNVDLYASVVAQLVRRRDLQIVVGSSEHLGFRV
ncbi:MAG: hypothetical protein ACI87O_000664 [Planctomycetota bacterium]|jgi:hypothetical protein